MKAHDIYTDTMKHLFEVSDGIDTMCEAYFKEGQNVLYKRLKKAFKDEKSLRILEKVIKREKKRLKM
jgi:hypothetical protein